MADFTLPFEQTATKLNADGTAFEVDCQGAFSVAIAGKSDAATGVYGEAGGPFPQNLVPIHEKVTASSPGAGAARLVGGPGFLIGGVVGQTNLQHMPGVCGASQYERGVWGLSDSGVGVQGNSANGAGVYGNSTNGMAIVGVSQNLDAINGTSSAPRHAGVSANNNNGGYGLWAKSTGPKPNSGGNAGYFDSDGADTILAQSSSSQHAAVSAQNNNGGFGVWAKVTGPNPNTGGVAGYFNSDGNNAIHAIGTSESYDAVLAESSSSVHAAVAAHGTKYGIWASGNPAGYFAGDVEVTGDIKLTGGDCAEHFDVVDDSTCDPGTVMVIDDSGALVPSSQEYDRRVAGVVSGAGDLRPGLILDQKADSTGRRPIALVGKACCKAVAQDAPIAVGDLLTTSALPGHAMKASDPTRAFGAVMGKALRPLADGQGLIRF